MGICIANNFWLDVIKAKKIGLERLHEFISVDNGKSGVKFSLKIKCLPLKSGYCANSKQAVGNGCHV
jgi:hypothetical protein